MESLSRVDRCPSCGTARSRALFNMPMGESTCRVVRCVACSLIYKDLVPAADAIADIYTDEYVHFQPEKVTPRDVHSARDKLRRCLAMLPRARRRGHLRVLDYGCGRGSFAEIARTLGFDAEGVDPFLPRELEREGLRRGTAPDLEPGSYDIIVMLNVAEHLTAPRPTFEALRRALRDDGLLLITCPYGESLAMRRYQDRWSHMAHDEHILFWTEASLTHLLRRLNFDGCVRYRVVGAPFPYGRVPSRLQHAAGGAAHARSAPPAPRPSHFSLQRGVWQVARTIQRSALLASAVRTGTHWTRSGDYLEYCIAATDHAANAYQEGVRRS